MSKTTRNRHNSRGKLMKRLNAGTDRAARKHRRLEARWKALSRPVVSQQASP
jgi:hypothetical protein